MGQTGKEQVAARPCGEWRKRGARGGPPTPGPGHTESKGRTEGRTNQSNGGGKEAVPEGAAELVPGGERTVRSREGKVSKGECLEIRQMSHCSGRTDVIQGTVGSLGGS